jgi:UPF0716 family protein affecting phage T7 exclusion
MQNPQARRDALEIQDLGDELVIYDVRADAAHALQPLAARVWQLSDGTRDVPSLHAALATEAPFADVTVAEVWSALDGLADASLLEARITPPGGEPITRRSAVLRVTAAGALGALTVPGLITSILAPMPLDAQSRVDSEQSRKDAEQTTKLDGEQSQKESRKDQNVELRSKEESAKGEVQQKQGEQSIKQQSEQTAKQQSEQSLKQQEQSTKEMSAKGA